MRKLILAISMIALAGSAAYADPIADREALMKERGKLVGGLSKVVKGEEAYDAAAVLAQLQALQANAEKFDVDVLFPAGSDQGDTTASPKIWSIVGWDWKKWRRCSATATSTPPVCILRPASRIWNGPLSRSSNHHDTNLERNYGFKCNCHRGTTDGNHCGRWSSVNL